MLNFSWVSTEVFIHCTPNFAVMANLRCGSTNMFNYFGIETVVFGVPFWEEHHNPILVLRNPLDRVVSSMPFLRDNDGTPEFRLSEFVRHSAPYLHVMPLINFRIIDFYNLEQYIPRMDTMFIQSVRTDARLSPSVAVEDVYVKNPGYTLQELKDCAEGYTYFMATRERVSVEEWRNLTWGYSNY